MQKQLREIADPVSAGGIALTIGGLIYLLKLYMSMIVLKGNYVRVSKRDEVLTAKLVKIVGDPNVVVYAIPTSEIDIYNAFNICGKQCFITEKLYNELTEGERIAILLHEYGHGLNADLHKGIATSSLLVSILTFIVYMTPSSMLMYWVVLIFGKLISDLISGQQSQAHERRADKFVKDCGYGKYLAGALKKIYSLVQAEFCKTSKLSGGECKRKFDDVYQPDLNNPFSTHPSINGRITDALKLTVIAKFVATENVSGVAHMIKFLEKILGVINRNGMTILGFLV